MISTVRNATSGTVAALRIHPEAIRRGDRIVYLTDGMSKPQLSTPVRSDIPNGTCPTGEQLVCAFNEVRIELVSTLYYMLGNYEDALDAVQDAFLKCWRNREAIEEVRNLRAWVFRIGLNAAKDLQRNAWRRRARPLAGATTLVEARDDCPVKSAEEREAKERLHQAILTLRPEEREVFLLRQNGCLTYEEIAKLRRSPVGTVKTQMRAATAKLRQALREK
jgi:RNA polymerase sigma-70 factor (ECF subfamily)